MFYFHGQNRSDIISFLRTVSIYEIARPDARPGLIYRYDAKRTGSSFITGDEFIIEISFQ